ncbi:hypothetical protein RIF29_29900 [Crotalaria pallida]|uniref:Uncharacterized protein n=1 Tax=Crotalaria pallida TaxID=3830 RepID=A0AAN9HXU9_CROPI
MDILLLWLPNMSTVRGKPNFPSSSLSEPPPPIPSCPFSLRRPPFTSPPPSYLASLSTTPHNHHRRPCHRRSSSPLSISPQLPQPPPLPSPPPASTVTAPHHTKSHQQALHHHSCSLLSLSRGQSVHRDSPRFHRDPPPFPIHSFNSRSSLSLSTDS